jgi:hypothetical protein
MVTAAAMANLTGNSSKSFSRHIRRIKERLKQRAVAVGIMTVQARWVGFSGDICTVDNMDAL